METIISATAVATLGALGWLAAKFLIKPYKTILDLRREAHDALTRYAHLSSDTPDGERQLASDTYYEIGIGLISCYVMSPRRVTWLICRGWRVHEAGKLLVIFGNEVCPGKNLSFAGLRTKASLIREKLGLRGPSLAPEWNPVISIEGDVDRSPPWHSRV